MSGTIAQLGIEVNSGDAVQAATDLDKLTQAGIQAEKAADDVSAGFKKTADAAEKLAAAEAKAAQATDDAKARLLEMAKTSLQNSEYYQKLTTSVTSNTSAMDLSRDSTASLAALAQRFKAESDALVGTTDKVADSTKKAAAATGVQAEGLQALLAKINPAVGALQKLDDQQVELQKYRKAGLIDPATFADFSAQIEASRVKLKGFGDDTNTAKNGLGALSLGSKQARENVLQLGNALAEGNIRIAAHNILEIGTNAGASALKFALLAVPVLAAAAALGLVAYAYSQGSKEQDEYNKSLILTGNYAGVSAGQLADMARQVSATVGTTGAAAAALATLAGSGKIASGSFEEITEAAISMEKAAGKSVDSTIAEFVKIADDPVSAAKSLNDQYHFLTESVYAQIVALKEQGDTIGATKLLTDTYASTVQERAGQITQNLGLIEKGWKGIKDAAAGALDATLNVGREETLEQQIAALQKKLADSNSYSQAPVIGSDNPSLIGAGSTEDSDRKQLAFLELQRDADNARLKFLGDEKVIQQEGIAAAGRIKTLSDANLTALEKRNKLQKDYLLDVEKLRKSNPDSPDVTPAAVAKGLANIADKNKDPKGPANQVDLSAFNAAQNSLKSIQDTYSNTQKELESAEKAGLISQASYSEQRASLIEQEAAEVQNAYKTEIAALEAIKDKSSTTAEQRISLDQKIADARTAMVKAQKDADSQQEVLATAEKGRLDKQVYAVNQYVQALSQQQKALELAGQRAVLGVGQGDKQNALNGQLNSQQDRFAQQSLDLENQRSDPSRNMSPEEFQQKTEALAAANQKATDQIRKNYADVQDAQGDWTNGATAAYANYLDSAKDVAGQTKSLFTNAFDSMDDAITNFALTGKLSFSDFAKSIISDLARIAERQASSAILSSLFGIGAGLLAGAGGGAPAASSFSVGDSTATFNPQLDTSGIKYNAKGGVYEGSGISSYSGSVVSKPTMFAFAKGTGLMGEAGPEAIMPLTRGANGKLGVQAVGGAGGAPSGGTQINVNVNIASDGSTSVDTDSQSASAKDFANTIGPMIEQVYDQKMRKDLGQGGRITKAIAGR